MPSILIVIQRGVEVTMAHPVWPLVDLAYSKQPRMYTNATYNPQHSKLEDNIIDVE